MKRYLIAFALSGLCLAAVSAQSDKSTDDLSSTQSTPVSIYHQVSAPHMVRTRQTDGGDRAQISTSAKRSGDGAVAQIPPSSQAPAGSIWYNGDFDGVNGLSNELDTSLGSSQFGHTYDDFNVTDPNGWHVTAVYSNDLTDTQITGATWEIRQGLSEGNPGTLIASGICVAPIVVPTGRGGFGFDEFMIECDGLNLCLMPGTYWLNVTPIGDLTGRSFDSSTSGANCLGTPCGNNQNAFFDSNFFGYNFTSTANVGQPYDFSMGVIGTPDCTRECVGPPPGLTLWLPFDETSGTTSTNLYLVGNNGTQIHNPTVTSGYVDHSLCFNGFNQGVTVPDYAAINPGKGNLSIDAWVRRSSSSGNSTRVIVDKRKPSSGIGYHLALSYGNLIFQLASSSGFMNYRDTGTVPADDQWHFVAVTVNRTSNSGGQFYIDGAPTGNFDPTNLPGNLNNTGAFNVAFSQLGGNSPWLGCIDEVEFFPRVLTAAEITSIYDAGSGGKCKSTVVQGSCAPSSSLCALVSGTNVIAYVPKGCWDSSCSASGVAVVTVEGSITTNTLIPTGIDVINSCAANAITGQVVCTANNNMVYVFKGLALDPSVSPNPFASGALGTIIFSGGTCRNCGVAMDATHNRAVIAMSTLTPPVGFVGGFQFLDLNTATLGSVIPSQAPIVIPLANISEHALIDPIRNLLLSANENNNYELIDVAPTPSPNPFYEMPIPNQGGLADSSGEDCSTGIALAPYEFTNQVLLTDLNSAVFTLGSPGSWTSGCSTLNTLTESSLSEGASGIAVAQGTHTGIVSGEFGGDGITAIALPPTSGVCVLPDWLSCNIGNGFINGLDPHTVTAYQSPSSGHAVALLANTGATILAVVDLTKMLNPSFVPRTSGSGLGHGCSSTLLPPTVVSFKSVP